MKTYRFNAFMTGLLYVLGTLFGILGAIAGGDLIASIVTLNPLSQAQLMSLVVSDASKITMGSFFFLMMGICLVLMTVFLYPVLRKDSDILAMGMLLFRGALEGSFYVISTLGFLAFVAVKSVVVSSADAMTLLSPMIAVLYEFQYLISPVGTLLFLIGSSCLYISFFRTKLIPRWLTIWGLIGVVPYLAYALLQFFHAETSIGLYLQMVLAPQEIVMGVWLVIKGFDSAALGKLIE